MAKGPQLYQNETWWFREGDDPPSEELIKSVADFNNPNCPLFKYVGNRNAVERLSRAAFDAWSRYNHACNDHSLILFGPDGTDKLSLAKLFAKTVALPFVLIQSESIQSVDEIFAAISRVCEQTLVTGSGESTLRLIQVDRVDERTGQPMGLTNYYVLPPMIVFFDEVHTLRENFAQRLAIAFDSGDSELLTESGITANTVNVCWIFGTSERSSLSKLFEARFEKLELFPA